MGMLGDTIGMNRADAIWRVTIGLLYLVLFALVIAPIILTVGLILMVIDVVWQFLFNSEGIAPMNLWTRSWDWTYGNAVWALSGRGEFTLWPF